MHDGLRDLRPDAADDAVRSHEADGGDGLEQVLRATSVSTVGTPVMSMMASSASVSTMRCSRVSITTWVRLLSSVPIMGTASTPSQSLTTGVESSSSSPAGAR